MTGIRLTGLVSGLDTDSIVSQLMSIERQPRSRIELQQTAVQARQSNLRDAVSKLNSLKLAVADLRSVAVWADTQSVETTDPTKVTARATAGVGPGGYDLTVTQLASAARRSYGYSAPAADSTLTIYDGAAQDHVRATVTLTAGMSLDDAVAAINAKPETGVFAVKVNDQLVLSSRTTGEVGNFTATDAGGALGAATQAVDGQDALFTVGSQSFQRSSNVVGDAIPGLELTLKARTTATTINVGGPAPDTGAVKDKIKAFVGAYNAVVTAIRADLDEKRVANPQNATDASKGSLFGDQGLDSILSDLRRLVSEPIDGTATGPALASLGITTGAPSTGTTVNSDSVMGKLVFDEARFDEAIAADPVAVRKLLGGVTGVPGFAQKLEGRLQPLVEAGGLLDRRIPGADSELQRIKDSLAAFDTKMDMREERYRKQFTALEQALSRSQSVQADLAQRIAALGQ
jgi:flagellar hook-associated protein 2